VVCVCFPYRNTIFVNDYGDILLGTDFGTRYVNFTKLTPITEVPCNFKLFIHLFAAVDSGA